MNSPTPTLLARMQLALEMARSIVSLKIPADVPGGPRMREMAVHEAAFLSCVRKLIDANPTGVRWLAVLAHAVVEKGREQGAEFEEIISEIADSTRQAVEARAKLEARQAAAENPKIQRPS